MCTGTFTSLLMGLPSEVSLIIGSTLESGPSYEITNGIPPEQGLFPFKPTLIM